MKNILIILVVLVLLGIGGYFLFMKEGAPLAPSGEQPGTPTEQPGTSTTGTPPADGEKVGIGTSVEGRPINVYHYGSGSNEVVFIGGIHGGYSWNTALVAFDLMDYLQANPRVVPNDVKVTVIPVLNPDGLYKVVGTADRFEAGDVKATVTESIPGRFNAHDVDLNRNFDCEWQKSAVWQSRAVDGGDAAFSEPESAAIRDYVAANKPAAVVAFFSAAGGVYGSSCGEAISPETRELMQAYASASGYPADDMFDLYKTSGDMTNWLAKLGIPAISVLLTDHSSVEWDKNLRGIKAVLDSFPTVAE